MITIHPTALVTVAIKPSDTTAYTQDNVHLEIISGSTTTIFLPTVPVVIPVGVIEGLITFTGTPLTLGYNRIKVIYSIEDNYDSTGNTSTVVASGSIRRIADETSLELSI